MVCLPWSLWVLLGTGLVAAGSLLTLVVVCLLLRRGPYNAPR